MSRPQLNRHLVLEHETQVPDGSGGFLRNWLALGAHWAEINAGSGRETSGPATTLSRVVHKITICAALAGSDARPLAGQRFRGHGRIYAIHAVAENAANARYLTCHTTEETVA